MMGGAGDEIEADAGNALAEPAPSEGPERTLVLRVAEALPKDAGRGLARLDPQDLERLGVQIGEVVEIAGKRRTVARAMPAYAAQRDQALIQMDGILRANAGAGLDERVVVRKTHAPAGQALLLAALDGSRSTLRGEQGRYLARQLDGIPVSPGDRVRVNLFGARAQHFTAVETSPSGPIVVGPRTVVRIQGGAAPGQERAAVTYEDIGGLRREMRRIREMIELPLRYPEVFERLGIDAPKGVLLHGPPGCGKTLIARAVAHETSAHFVHINGPEIMAKYYGEAEANLRARFEAARGHAPAIIFIDEIDAIAPKREEMSGDRMVERRVVSQLLTLMDGLESRGEVVVIGATNVPNTLDPALRRPGRFDREIAIAVPDRDARLEILQIHTRGMPLAQDVALERLAAITHGFVGADLQALTREAAMITLRRLMPDINFASTEIPDEKLMALEVTMDDFRAALAEVGPSAIREVFTEVADVRWEDVGGLAEVKALLIETVEWPLRHGALFEQLGVRPPKGILLHGLPGTGKTLLAKALARESEANFIAVKGPQLLSPWVGESERAVREVFKKARQAAPCIVFFDELDVVVPRRGAGGDSQVVERVVGQLLTEMDGIEELRGVLVVAATNRLDRVDPALLRPGRFELQVELPVPDLEARRAIFAVHTRATTLGEDVDLDDLAARTDAFVGAEIEAVCRRAALLTIREYLEGEGHGAGTARLVVAARHFAPALAEAALRLRHHREREAGGV